MASSGYGYLVGAAAIGLFIVWGVTTDHSPGPDIEGAKSACKTAVLEQLKAPSTARFGDVVATGESADADLVSGVHGTVTSENTFGAALTTDFACSIDPGGNATVRILG